MEYNYRKSYFKSEVDFAGQIELQNSNSLISYFKKKSTVLYNPDYQYFDKKSIHHYSSGFTNKNQLSGFHIIDQNVGR